MATRRVTRVIRSVSLDDICEEAIPAFKAKKVAKKAAAKPSIPKIEMVETLNSSQLEKCAQRRKTLLNIAQKVIEGMSASQVDLLQSYVDVYAKASNNIFFSKLSPGYEIGTSCLEGRTFQRGESLMTYFREDFVPASELSPIFQVKKSGSKFPTARHMYFFVHVTLLQTTMYRHQNFLENTIGRKSILNARAPIKSIDFFGTYLSGLTVGVDHSTLRTSSHIPLESASSVDRYRTEVHGINVVLYEILDRVGFLTVEDILTEDGKGTTVEDKLKVLTGRIAPAKSFRRRRPAEEDLHEDEIVLYSGVLVEGIHWNTHRRDEIADYITPLSATYQEVLNFHAQAHAGPDTSNDFDDDEEEEDGYSRGSKGNQHSRLARLGVCTNSMMHLAFDARDPDSPCEVLQVGSSLVALNTFEFDLFFKNILNQAQTPDQRRRSALRALTRTTAHRLKNCEEAVRAARSDLLRREIEYQDALTVHNNILQKGIKMFDGLQQLLNSNELIAKSEVQEDMVVHIETVPIFAEIPISDESGEIKETVTRYVGVFQIDFRPLKPSIRIRNIKAPLYVQHNLIGFKPFMTKGRVSSSRAGLTYQASKAMTQIVDARALLHPHCDPNSYPHSICLGGFKHQMQSSTTRLGLRVEENPSMNLLLVLLQFLQSVHPSDSYASCHVSVMPEGIPSEGNYGISNWDCVMGDFSDHTADSVFGIPVGEVYKNKFMAKDFIWPGEKETTAMLVALFGKGFEHETEPNIPLHMITPRGEK